MTDELHPALDVDDLGRVSLGVVGDQQELRPVTPEERERYAAILAAMPPIWSCGRCNKVTPKAHRRGDVCSRCVVELEPIPGQLEIGGDA